MDKQDAVLTALTDFNIIENNPAESEKIGVQAGIGRPETEGHLMDEQHAALTALTASNITENNCTESEKIGVQKVFD